jgi:hypothetical protein
MKKQNNMANRDKAMQEVDRFHIWLRDTIKSVHYANHERMANAYATVYKNSMDLQTKHDYELII